MVRGGFILRGKDSSESSLYGDARSSHVQQNLTPQQFDLQSQHMSYGLNLGWGGPIMEYIGFWGGPTRGYTTNLVQGSYKGLARLGVPFWGPYDAENRTVVSMSESPPCVEN